MKHTFNALCAILLILAGLTSCGSLTPRVTKEIEMADPCTVLVFRSRAIARGKLPTNDLGKACVSLPASYASSPDRRYPVVYALNGFGDGALAMLRAIRGVTAEHPQDTPEFILVAIDGGTSFYANSPASGYWEDMITQEAISLIDSRYRTIAGPEGRILAGFSPSGAGTARTGTRMAPPTPRTSPFPRRTPASRNLTAPQRTTRSPLPGRRDSAASTRNSPTTRAGTPG